MGQVENVSVHRLLTTDSADERILDMFGRVQASVLDVYQVAQHGTEALIVFHGEDLPRDAWCWWDRVTPGTTLAVATSSGYGPHTHRVGVIYIGSQNTGSGVYDSVSTRTAMHAQRHHDRAASVSGRQPGRSVHAAT